MVLRSGPSVNQRVGIDAPAVSHVPAGKGRIARCVAASDSNFPKSCKWRAINAR